jgi:tetratricopeptide (TPR) repeat protein
MHAPSSVTYSLELPVQPAVLRFDMGFDPQAQSWLGDGATFEVFVDGERVFLEHVDEAMALKGWHRRAVDLSSWAGQPVELTLAVTPGPQADPAGDWAGWGEPWVVDARWPELEALNAAGRAKEAWEEAGYTAERLADIGKMVQADGLDEEAGRWYQRALRLVPESEEFLKLLGSTGQGDELALRYLSQGGPEAIEKVKWLRPGDLNVNYQLWQAARETGDLAMAKAYRETLRHFPLEAIHPRDERLLDYATEVIPALLDKGIWDRNQGLRVVSTLVWRYSEMEGTLRLLEQLSDRYPTEAEWFFYLGELHQRRGDLDRAERDYQQSLLVDPAYAQAYLRLGMVAEARCESWSRDCSGLTNAHNHYRQYNKLAPEDFLGLKRLAEVSASLGISDTAVLRESFAGQSGGRATVAKLLNLSVEDVELGPNLVDNGDFESW